MCELGCVMTGLSPRRPSFYSGSVRRRFVMDSVILGRVFLRVVKSFLVSIIFANTPHSSSSLYYSC